MNQHDLLEWCKIVYIRINQTLKKIENNKYCTNTNIF